MNTFSQWLWGWYRSRPGAAANRRPSRVRLRLEALEDRVVPAVFNVNSTADILNPAAGKVTLRSAIQQANTTAGGNTINLTVAGTYKITLAGTPGETDNAAGELAILPIGNLSIVNTSGGTVVVDANHLNRVFDISPGNTDNPATKFAVTMQGFTIQNGLAQPGDAAGGSGGGIRDQGNQDLTLINMTLQNNEATADGGGVSMENVPASTPWILTVNNSIIQGNHAGDAGGGLETDGKGKVFINTGTQILNNTCVNQGAGVWLDATMDGVASVTVTNPGTGYTTAPTVTFSAPQNAGEVTATGTATITGGVVTGVTITNPGSGYTAPPTVTFSAPPAGITATGTANLGFNNSANLTISGVLIAGNSAITGPGGGIGNAGNGAVSITNSTIQNNFAAMTGGGFADQNNLGTLVVSNSLFLNNSATMNGGGVQEGGSLTTISNSEFRGNSTNAAGGGVFANGTTLAITNSTFSDNTSAFTGTATGNVGGGGIEVETTGTATITNSTIVGNSALNNAGLNNGGGIDASANFLGTLTLINDTINGNYADTGGGLFWAGTTGTTVTLLNTIVAQNQANLSGPDIKNLTGTITDGGGNIIGISVGGSGNTGFTQSTTLMGTVATPLDPGLAPLGPNGGPKAGSPTTAIYLDTEALLLGSQAIDQGIEAGSPATDQLGDQRSANGSTTPSSGAVDSFPPLLTIQGNPNDAFIVQLTTPFSYTLNGTQTSIPPGVTDVKYVSATSGITHADVYGSGNDVATITPTKVTLVENGFTVELDNVGVANVHSSGATSTATYTLGSGDTFVDNNGAANPNNFSQMVSKNNTYYLGASGFAATTATAVAGSGSQAWMETSTTDTTDTMTGTPTSATIMGPAYNTTANNFAFVAVFANNTSASATLSTSTTSATVFGGVPAYSFLQGTSYYLIVVGFHNVTVTSNNAGDIAYIGTSSNASDTYVGNGSTSNVVQGTSYNITALGFSRVQVYGSSSQTATLKRASSTDTQDSPGSGIEEIKGTGYDDIELGFGSVTVV